MNLIFAKINLHKSNYAKLSNYKFLQIDDEVVKKCNLIYKQYCNYKKFTSVVPIWDYAYFDPKTDVIGYFDYDNLVAFSIIKKWDSNNAECIQFAWNYENPKLRLGIESLKNECAVYKEQGYKYLYLGLADEYKSKIDGYEIVGSI